MTWGDTKITEHGSRADTYDRNAVNRSVFHERIMRPASAHLASLPQEKR
jgi:hypothetical protein